MSATVLPTTTPPRWAVLMAYSVPLLVLPSAAWRTFTALSESPCHDPGDLGRTAYLLFLSGFSLVLASLTIGLVRPWGEVFPRWVPRLGGRSVPSRPVVVTAFSGAAALCGFVLYAVFNDALGWGDSLEPLPPGCEPPGAEVLAFYAPLVAWGPALLAVTFDYRRRQRARAQVGRWS